MKFKTFIWIIRGIIVGLTSLVLLNLELYKIMSWDLEYKLEFDMILIK